MSWKRCLRESFTSYRALLEYLQLPAEDPLSSGFPLLVPKRLAEKMEKGNALDPLFLQFAAAPSVDQTGFSQDPVEDHRFQVTPRLLHKYEGRVLLVTTGACAMHCRYCFRQNYPYEGGADWEQELAYIRGESSIKEVILSGGDPLSLSNGRLEGLIRSLGEIEHLQRLRIHTRFLMGIPERMDEGLCELLAGSRLQVWFVVHCNHPREIDSAVEESLQKVLRLGVPVLNQAVLLRGVNDSVQTLQQLAERLGEIGVQFYYLHQLDRVAGAGRFEVDQKVGLALIEQLSKQISGYLVPQYVKEEPGEPRKTPIGTTNPREWPLPT